MDMSKSLAGRAGPFPGIEGKEGAGDLVHSLAAFTAIHIYMEISSFFPDLFPAVGRADPTPAMRACPHAQFFIYHPQIRIDIRQSPDCGTGVSVGVRLGDDDGRRGSSDPVYFRLADSLERHRLQVLPLAFVEEDVDKQRGFSAAGQAGEYDQLILWNL